MADAAVDRIAVGTVIARTYTVTAFIGRGGAGAVWAARHLRLPGKHVAIKVLLVGGGISPEAHTRFRQEAEIVSRLRHPNIVDVFDFNELPNGTPYMVLELLAGEDLRKRLHRGPLTLEATLAIARQVGSALNAAHKQRIVHRDLKPANIFLCPDDSDDVLRDRVKVLDFGISKIHDSDAVRTQADVLLGTPMYMSPEQALCKHDIADHRTDEFALGAIVYEMLSGRPAFPGDGFAEILMRVVHDAPMPLRDLVPGLLPHITASVERALEKDPDKRFADIASFVAALTGGRVHSLEMLGAPPPASQQAATLVVKPIPVPPADAVSEVLPASSPEQTPLPGQSIPSSSLRWDRRLIGRLAIGPSHFKIVWWVSLTVCAVLIGGAAVHFTGTHLMRIVGRQPPVPIASREAPVTITVMEFENQRSDDVKDNWYCKALQTAFTTELSRFPAMNVIAPEIIQRSAKEEGLHPMTVARRLGVNRFITGSFAVMGNTLRIDARIVETEKGLQEAAENVEGSQDEFFSLQKQLALITLDHFRVRLTEADKASLNKPTNARLDKYRMLLGAEGVTEPAGAPAVTPVGPQAREPAGQTPQRRGARSALLAAFSWTSVAYAQTPPESPEGAVRQVLDEYRRAHEEGNLDHLAALYVSFPPSQRDALSAYLKGIKQLRVELVDVKIQPREHEVAVSYTRRDNFIDTETGEPVSLEVRVTKFLVQDGSKWKFTEGG